MTIDNAGNSKASIVEFWFEGQGIDIPPGPDFSLIVGMVVVVAIIAVGLYVLLRKRT